MGTPISRRQFWRIPVGDFAKTLLGGRKETIKEDPVIRPPGGAGDPQRFLDRCERCGGCASACPHEVIDLLGPSGGRGEGSPYLKPQEAPCQWCPSWDCINACPTGALSFPDTGQPPAIAKAVLNLDLCLVSQNILCDDCVQVCPSSIHAISQEGRFPKIDAETCVGCGLCSYYCAADPAAITIEPI